MQTQEDCNADVDNGRGCYVDGLRTYIVIMDAGNFPVKLNAIKFQRVDLLWIAHRSIDRIITE